MNNVKEESLVSSSILINGKAVSEDVSIYHMNIQQSVNRITTAQISIIEGSAASENFPLSDSSNFIPGNEIEIQAGFGLKQQSLFTGIIVAQSIKIRRNEGSLLELTCKDKAVSMTLERKNRVFTDKTDSNILKEIIQSYGLTAEVDSTTNSYSQMLQYYASDWDFLISRAEVNGLLVVNTQNKLLIKKPETSSEASLSLSYGVDIFAFDSQLNAIDQYESINATSWNYKEQNLESVSVNQVDVSNEGNLQGGKIAINASSYNLQTTVALDEGELKSWAEGKLIKSRLSKIRGRIKAYGNAAYQPNQIVELEGLGKRFNGKAFISGVEHSIEHGNWWSYLTLGLDPFWFSTEYPISAPEASALLPGIPGLQNGIVKQIIDDPLEETRILVEIPIAKGAESSTQIWARWAQPYASEKAGFFFMPEIEDEVVLGFLNADPRYPIILGSLYSSKHEPPLTPASENPLKSIQTKSQLTIQFDDEKKIILMQTPGGNKISLDDDAKKISLEDQHGNQISMDEDGISLKSAKDIQLTAEGKINIQANTGISISSDTELSLSAESNLSASGLEVSLSAETSFSASGEAEASLSASGELSLQAGLIMIN